MPDLRYQKEPSQTDFRDMHANTFRHARDCDRLGTPDLQKVTEDVPPDDNR